MRESLPQLRAALVALTGLAMLVLGFPGLDHLPNGWLQDPAARAERADRPLGWLWLAVADVDHHVRRPVERALAPLQRPLRIAQSWSLYGVGPNRARRAEIRVDGELWHRSGDPDHRWLHRWLRARRIRPILVNACRDDSPHAARLVEAIAAKARQRDPGITEIELRCTSQRWPGDGEAKTVLQWYAAAPEWSARR